MGGGVSGTDRSVGSRASRRRVVSRHTRIMCREAMLTISAGEGQSTEVKSSNETEKEP